MIIEETSELEHAWNYTKHMYTHTLVQCPLQFYATPMRGDTEEDVCALLDTEGSDIFISAKLVEDFGYIIEPHQAVVKDGDGSKQISPAYVWATISIGVAFKVRYRFCVVKLDGFDVIIGINDSSLL